MKHKNASNALSFDKLAHDVVAKLVDAVIVSGNTLKGNTYADNLKLRLILFGQATRPPGASLCVRWSDATQFALTIYRGLIARAVDRCSCIELRVKVQRHADQRYGMQFPVKQCAVTLLPTLLLPRPASANFTLLLHAARKSQCCDFGFACHPEGV